MNNTQKSILFGGIAAVTVILVGSFALTVLEPKVIQLQPIEITPQGEQLGAVTNYLDTSSSDITHATTTINASSTQVFSSITKIGQVINYDTVARLTCSMDATGTTAASSTVATNKGIIIAPAASTTPSSAMFGECYPGSMNCYTHKGAVNCMASATTSLVSKWSK